MRRLVLTCLMVLIFVIAFANLTRAEERSHIGELIELDYRSGFLRLRDVEGKLITFPFPKWEMGTRTSIYKYIRQGITVEVKVEKVDVGWRWGLVDVLYVYLLNTTPEQFQAIVEEIRQEAMVNLRKKGIATPSEKEIAYEAWSLASSAYLGVPSKAAEKVKNYFWE